MDPKTMYRILDSVSAMALNTATFLGFSAWFTVMSIINRFQWHGPVAALVAILGVACMVVSVLALGELTSRARQYDTMWRDKAYRRALADLREAHQDEFKDILGQRAAEET